MTQPIRGVHAHKYQFPCCSTFVLTASTTGGPISVGLKAQVGGEYSFSFCTSSRDCASGSFCAVIMCVSFNVYSDVVNAISGVYDTVSGMKMRCGRWSFLITAMWELSF